MDRERHLYLYLSQETQTLTESSHVLHIAPEPRVRNLLRSNGRLRYLTADRLGCEVDLRMDIRAIPCRDSLWDVVICSHVLEHVREDEKAIRELLRVVRPGGVVLLLVPLAPGLEESLEEDTPGTPEERLGRFGQEDHVRVYGRDFRSRVRRVGFEEETYRFSQ